MKVSTKVIIPVILLIIIATSCKQGWSESEKKAFIERCMARELINGRTEKQDREICDCLLQKTIAKCPQPKDTVNIAYREVIEWGAKCQGYE